MTTALPIEVRKIGYRQAKDGFVVSFVIHPNEAHDWLATAAIGARFMAALVEINDDETPKEPSPTRQALEASVAQERKQYSLPQRVAVVCNEPAFYRFLLEIFAAERIDDVAQTIRDYCGVTSRKEILPGTEAAKRWDKLHTDYLLWSKS